MGEIILGRQDFRTSKRVDRGLWGSEKERQRVRVLGTGAPKRARVLTSTCARMLARTNAHVPKYGLCSGCKALKGLAAFGCARSSVCARACAPKCRPTTRSHLPAVTLIIYARIDSLGPAPGLPRVTCVLRRWQAAMDCS